MGFIYAVLIITIAVIAMVTIAPGITVSRGGKILAFLALFILPVLSGSLGYEQHMDRSKQTTFCLSCHVMEPYGRSLHVDDPTWLPAAHYQNNRVPRDEACYTCHTDYVMYGTIKAKWRGLHHVYVQYFGNPNLHYISTIHTTTESACIVISARAASRKAQPTMPTRRLWPTLSPIRCRASLPAATTRFTTQPS